jgi:predicted site-specific integrase-resolvase
MPRKINGQIFYETLEICQRVGISRPTLFRWLKKGIIEKSYKDRNGWRLFSKDNLNEILMHANGIEVQYSSTGKENGNHKG